MMWKNLKLKEICSVFTDGDWIEKKDQSSEGIRLIQTGNVKTGKFADRRDKARYISEETFKRLNCTDVKEGDILVSRLPEPVGRACIIPKLQEKAITAVDCTVIRIKDHVLPSYLNYYMQSPQYFSLVQEKVTGATRQRISRKNLGEVLVSFPPLAEQQRIVAKLNAAFTEIDEAVSKTLKKIKNNDDLFESILNETFQNPTFKYENLDNICKIVGGGTPNKKNKSFYDGTIPWATVRDLGYDNLNKTEHQITDNAVNESSTNIIPSGNIVIATRVGLGKVCTLSQNTAINQDLKGIIPINNEKTDIGFLFFWFKSIRNVIINAGTGATVQGVRLDFIKSLKIPNLELPLQKQITSKLSIISEKNKLLNSIYKEKINNLAKLKSNILQQEFQMVESA